MLTTHQPNAPTGRWVRLSRAAHRTNMTPRLLLAEIEAGKLPCRTTRLGARQMIHVAENDIATAELMLAARCTVPGSRG